MTEEATSAYEGLAVVELMGHRVVAGRVCQVAQYGTAQLRVDVLDPSDPTGETVITTTYYGGPAIYGLTPASLEIVLEANKDQFAMPPVVRAALRPAKEVPALPAPTDWTSVTAGLPDDGMEVSVCHALHRWQTVAYYASDEGDGGAWIKVDDPYEPMDPPPTHWRSLDLPPMPPSEVPF